MVRAVARVCFLCGVQWVFCWFLVVFSIGFYTNVDGKHVCSRSFLEAGKKSIAFGITLQDSARTLQDEDINPLAEKVVTSLKETFNVTLRE